VEVNTLLGTALPLCTQRLCYSRAHIRMPTGKVQTEHLKQLDALLKSNNETAFSELLETNCQSTESDARVTIRQNHLVIDDEHSPATLPRSLTQFLVDFVMAQD